MSKLEKEVKVLDVDVNKTKEKLFQIGAVFKGTKKQSLYTYDIPTIYYRILECLELLNSSNELLVKTNKLKLEIVLIELTDLIDEVVLNKIYFEMNIKDFSELLSFDGKEIIKRVNSSKTFNDEIKKYLINGNKWVRLRQSNDKVELTVKHIFNKNDSSIQKVSETEINTSSFDETNRLLESLGLVKRNYQEKIRHSFVYKDAEIEIDEWPNLEPYMEIECDNDHTIDEIIRLLNFSDKEIVSLNTEELYRRKNMDILKMDVLKF